MASKGKELPFLRAFQDARPDLGLHNPKCHESPDFLFDLSPRILGLEVTRFTPKTKPGFPISEEQHSLRQRAMDVAREQYQLTRRPPLHVEAVFDESRPLTKTRVPQLATEIVTLLSANTHPFDCYERSELLPTSNGSFLLEVTNLSKTRVPAEKDGAWFPAGWSWVRHADKTDILRIIAAKEKLVPEYRYHCKELWLLIAFVAQGNEVVVRAPVEPIEYSVQTGFDRIFCLEVYGSRVIEIPTAKISGRHA